MLQSLVRKVPSRCEAGTFLIAMTRTEQLHGVGRERARAIETAVDYPRMLAVLTEVLAAHDDRPAARMAGDVVVDVLRRVRLVVGDEGTGAESQVLHEDGIDRHRSSAFVCCLDAPEPCGLVPEHAQRYAMADAFRHAFPDDPVAGHAEPDLGARTDRVDVGRARAAHAQQNASDAAIDGRGEDLVDEYRAAVASMLDGEDRTVQQNANAESCVVEDATQTQIALARRAPATDVGGGHQ